MGTTAANRRAARALAVLAVLLGLLAMHGLASTHHAAASTTAAQHGTGQHQVQPPEHHHDAAHGSGTLAAPDRSSCGDDCPDLGVLCVAVLTGAALLALLLARRGRAALLPAPARHDAAVTRTPPMRQARGPDPVKELCVSRT